MNEADDTKRLLGFNHRLKCGHYTPSEELEFHGPLRNIAEPMLTIGETSYCGQCNEIRQVNGLRIWVIKEEKTAREIV